MGKSVLASTTLLVDAPSIMSTSEIYDTSNSTRAAELDPLPPEVVGMKPFDRPEGIVLESVDDEDELSMTMTNCEAAVVERAEFTPLLNNVESQLDSDGNLRRRCGRCVGGLFGWRGLFGWNIKKKDIDPLGLSLLFICILAFCFCAYITFIYFSDPHEKVHLHSREDYASAKDAAINVNETATALIRKALRRR